MKKIAIIGGGISGLSITYFVLKKIKEKQSACEIILIDKNTELGGNVTTFCKDGFVIEGGPDCFISEKPSAIRLCEELGLGDSLINTKEENKRTYVLSKGKLIELPEGLMLMVPTKITPFIFSPLISIPGKIRMGMDLFIPAKKNNYDESLGSFVRRRLGNEALDKIAEPLVAGIHAGDPENMSLKNTFPRFLDMENKYGSLIKGMLAQRSQQSTVNSQQDRKQKPEENKRTMFMSLKGGLVELINKIHEKIAPEIKILLDKKVNSINKIQIADNKVKYEIKMNENEVIEADYIIVTSPAYETGRMISGFASELASMLNNFPYVSTATVSVGFKRSEIYHPLKGFGFVIPRKEKRKIMASTWTSEKFSFRAPSDSVLMRAFLGGAANSDILKLNEEEILEVVLKEWQDIMGIKAKPVISKTFRWNKAMPQYIIGHEKTVENIEKITSLHEGLTIAGNYLKGVGISDCILNAYNTAEKIVDKL